MSNHFLRLSAQECIISQIIFCLVYSLKWPTVLDDIYLFISWYCSFLFLVFPFHHFIIFDQWAQWLFTHPSYNIFCLELSTGFLMQFFTIVSVCWNDFSHQEQKTVIDLYLFICQILTFGRGLWIWQELILLITWLALDSAHLCQRCCVLCSYAMYNGALFQHILNCFSFKLSPVKTHSFFICVHVRRPIS